MRSFQIITTLEDGVTREIQLPEGEYSIGREYGCDIIVPADTVSRRHVRITLDADGVKLEDLQSTHGTLVNGAPIEGRTRLDCPCAFEVGPVRIDVALEPDDKPLPAGARPISESNSAPPPEVHSHFDIGEEIAKGGMGAILKARDRNLERAVAMKVILAADQASDDSRHRFVREALILARLEHPNIVPIHEVGRDAQGRLFYVMKLVKGRTLQAILEDLEAEDQETLSHYTLDRLLTVFRKVCDAIAFAHYHGVIHRDLKPENVMVGEFGEVLVMDWGLAKILHDEEHNEFDRAHGEAFEGFQELSESQLASNADNLTLAGSVIGSPLYMPPEQADGRLEDIGAHSDIYSLGGILYSILTLRTPVAGQKLGEVLSNVKSGNITPPVRIGKSKSRGSRLSSGTIASPSGIESLPHCPRGKPPAVLSIVTMRAMALKPKDRFESASDLGADIEKFQGGFSTSVEQLSFVGHLLLLIRRNKALSFSLIAGSLVVGFLGFYLLSTMVKAQRNAAAEEQLYFSRMRQMADLWSRNRLSEMELRLQQTAQSPHRGWEWNYWQKQSKPYRLRLFGHKSAVSGVAIAPNGKLIATASHDKTIKIWDAARGIELRSLVGHEGAVNKVAFTADSQSVASVSADGSARLWNIKSGQIEREFVGHSGSVRSVAISPNERWLFTGGADRSGRIWDLATGAQVHQLESFGSAVIAGEFSPDGKRLVAGSERHSAKIWDVASGRMLANLELADVLQDLAFVTDGKQVVTTHRNGLIRWWNAETGKQVREQREETADTQLKLARSPAGRRVLSGRWGNLVVLRDGATLATIKEFRGLQHDVTDLALAPDESWIVAGSRDGALVWDVGELRGPTEFFQGHAGAALSVAFSSDGKLLATTSLDNTARIWDAESGAEIHKLTLPNGAWKGHAEFAAEDKILITARGKIPQVWDATTGQLIRALDAHAGEIRGLSVAPDGSRAATADAQTIRIWNPASGEMIREIRSDPTEFHEIAFYPDSRRLVSCKSDGIPVVWDTDTGENLIALERASNARFVSVSANGRMIATSGADGRIELWNADTGKHEYNGEGRIVSYGYPALHHPRAVASVRFLGDGRRIVSAGADGSVRLWHVAEIEGRDAVRSGEVISFDTRGGWMHAVACSADGRKIAAAGFDPAADTAWIKIWDPGPLKD